MALRRVTAGWDPVVKGSAGAQTKQCPVPGRRDEKQPAGKGLARM